MDRDEVRRLAAGSIERGDAVGWFEELYRHVGGKWDAIPWADLAPNPYLIDWLDSPAAGPVRGSCLVAGCGLGDDAEALAARGWDVVAFDVSTTAISGCRARDRDEPEGQLPWPLTREEIDAFQRHGLAPVRVESFLDTESPPVRRFRALYARPPE